MLRIARVLLVLSSAAGPLAAQGVGLYPSFAGLTGFEAQVYNFDPGINTKLVSQWHVPIVAVVPLSGPLSFDVTTNYASQRFEAYDGTVETLSGLTDTQLRLLYTLSPDRFVGSVSFNLPTGQHSVPSTEFNVVGAVGSNYLSFPVPNPGTSFGVTTGLAYAARAGSWDVGISGSVRYLASYQPFSDDDTLSYKPGVEGRVRAGVDRLLGERARFLLGFTVSTFSSDDYTGTNQFVSQGSYAPGTRLIGDATFLRVIGRCTLTASAWDLYRVAGSDTSGSILGTKENVVNGELRLTWPVGPRFQVEPMAGYRESDVANYLNGRMGSGGVTLRMGLTDRLSLTVVGRYDTGWIYDPISGRADFTGFQGSFFLRMGQ
ncbi:MAG TPA: hypothetical protein VN848_02650 [Gemmatimonadales bacterium]|nr:hypothetical protein [Gemmatimonadales bacterium]